MGRRRREEEEEEEEEKKRSQDQAKVWMLAFGMETTLGMYFVWMLGFWFGTIWFCMDFLSRYMFVG